MLGRHRKVVVIARVEGAKAKRALSLLRCEGLILEHRGRDLLGCTVSMMRRKDRFFKFLGHSCLHPSLTAKHFCRSMSAE
jgi:hypothetical protein